MKKKRKIDGWIISAIIFASLGICAIFFPWYRLNGIVINERYAEIEKY